MICKICFEKIELVDAGAGYSHFRTAKEPHSNQCLGNGFFSFSGYHVPANNWDLRATINSLRTLEEHLR